MGGSVIRVLGIDDSVKIWWTPQVFPNQYAPVHCPNLVPRALSPLPATQGERLAPSLKLAAEIAADPTATILARRRSYESGFIDKVSRFY